MTGFIKNLSSQMASITQMWSSEIGIILLFMFIVAFINLISIKFFCKYVAKLNPIAYICFWFSRIFLRTNALQKTRDAHLNSNTKRMHL